MHYFRKHLILIVGLTAVLLLSLTVAASGSAGSLGGVIYHDANGNGVRDSGEAALPGVYVTVSAGDWSHDFYSGDDGTYAPAGLTGGDYTVKLVVPDCYRPTTRPYYDGVWIDGGAPSIVRGLDFGLAKAPRCGGPAPHKPPPAGQHPMPPTTWQPPKTQAPERPSHYTIQPGDQLAAIAKRFDVSLDALVGLNQISNPNLIYVGQTLALPGASGPTGGQVSAPASPPEPARSHTVQAGEGLAGVARHYGTTVGALVAANHIANPNLIYVGQTLIIP